MGRHLLIFCLMCIIGCCHVHSKVCPDPDPPSNGGVEVTPQPHKTGSGVQNGPHAVYSCDVGYQLQGSSERQCKAGIWDGDAPTCEDIDECTNNTHNCHANADCENTPVGSFTCTCNAGYLGNGISCTDIDECADANDNNCNANDNAVCVNSPPGSFTCTCSEGYTGDGVTTCDAPRSCTEWKNLGATCSGIMEINPTETRNFDVYCDFEAMGGVGVTVVHHDQEECFPIHDADYRDPGSYTNTPNYNDAIIAELIALADLSGSCRQFVGYKCHGSVAKYWANVFREFLFWRNRVGIKIHYWGGAPQGSQKCACGVTGTCVNNPTQPDWCNDNVWREDSGYLEFKDDLPLTVFAAGDADASSEHGIGTIGPLECYG